MRSREAVVAGSGPWLFPLLCVAALAVRLAVVVFGEWQDNNMPVKYTDVDYSVFTDAARLVAAGKTPFLRTTYRYTPLLAWMMVPNVLWHPVFGKLLFVGADIAIGVLLYQTLRWRRLPVRRAALFASAWLFHPFSINISTRGNADSLVSVLVLGAVAALFSRRLRLGAVLYGSAVHVKLYPIVYALSFFLFLDEKYAASRGGADGSAGASRVKAGRGGAVGGAPGHGDAGSDQWQDGGGRLAAARQLRTFFSPPRLEFALISAGTFVLLTAACYNAYGYEFLFETYLYHFVRADNRHNFSIFFYQLFLRYGAPTSLFSSLLGFAPQMALVLAISVRYRADLPFALFLHTLAFVAFNKVCTAQYFVWYTSLLPLVLPQSRVALRWKGLCMIGVWFATELHWLFWGYRLEFLGENVFFSVWLAGCAFFVANVWIFVEMVHHHTEVPVFKEGELVDLGAALGKHKHI
jgi:phosphatidylinositol glycan class M